jgi:hypothetical protein
MNLALRPMHVGGQYMLLKKVCNRFTCTSTNQRFALFDLIPEPV